MYNNEYKETKCNPEDLLITLNVIKNKSIASNPIICVVKDFDSKMYKIIYK